MLYWLHMDTVTTVKPVADIDIVGGHPAMDFINTVHSRYPETKGDYLRTYDDLVEWHVRVGLIPAATGRQLQAFAKEHPGQAQGALKFSAEIRELLYRIFSNVIHNKHQQQADLDQLNRALADLRCCQQLASDGTGIKLHWQIDTCRLRTLLGPVVESAVELLTSDRLDRVKECPPPEGCGWLFLDTSRNGSRCWCSMKTCGNLAKVRRHRKKNQ